MATQNLAHPPTHMQEKSDLAIAALKAAPPATVSTLTWFGYPISEWVQVLMLIYAGLLCVQVSWNLIDQRREKRKQREAARGD